MRSKKTTNILLLLAFLFILTIIILCLIPTKRGPADGPHYKGLDQHEPEKTTSRTTTTKATTVQATIETITTPEETSTYNTTKEEEEATLSTEETTTEKHLPPTTVKGETSHSPHSSSERTSTTPITTPELTTLPKSLFSNTTEHSARKETVPYTESTESPEDSFGHTTSNYTSVHSTTSNTILTIFTTTPTTVTTTTSETSIPTSTTTTETSTPTTTTETSTPTPTIITSTTTTETSTPTTTTETSTPTSTITTTTTIKTSTPTTTITTKPFPSIIPYDPTFKLYNEPEGTCTSNDCKDISGKMLDSIDHETDPCKNFHEYSCGGVHNDEFLKPENAEENLDNILKEQLVAHKTSALKFYNSCLNFLDGTGNLKHEDVFQQDWKVDSQKSETTNWPSVHLTKTISNLIKRDLPVLFDVEADVRKLNGAIKILPKIRISLFDEYEDHYDHKYCIDQFHLKMMELNNKNEEKGQKKMLESLKKRSKRNVGKGNPENQTEAKDGKLQNNSTEENEEIIDIDLNSWYQQYQECMNETGLDLRMNRLESVLMESDLFARGLKPGEKQSQIEKVKLFLMDLNEIYFTPVNRDGAETSFNVTTLSDLIGNNTVLGELINWDSLLESLHGSRLEDSQEIIVENLEKFSRIFSYFKEQWSDKNLENVLLMLAGEKLFKKGEDREYKKNFCFKMAKKYLPLDMQFLFTKSFSEEDLNVLVSEIYNLGSTVSSVFAELMGGKLYLQTHVEFINKTTLESNMKIQNSKLALSGDFLGDLYLLQTRNRENMYSISGKGLEDSESCRLLPREVQIPCNLHAGKILVPLEQLVPPNFLFRKDMPYYLRLAGVTYYMTKMMALRFGTDEINLESYKGNECLIENIPTNFEERNSKLRIKYRADVTEEMKSETLMEFQAFHVAWRVIKNLTSPKSGLKLNETEELPLIWLGSKSLNPLKAFLIRKAQETCNVNNEFDLIRISRFKSPPNSFWINSLIKIDTLYGGAWHCASNSSMAQTRECPPELTTSGWSTLYTRN